jgi:Putative adhesin
MASSRTARCGALLLGVAVGAGCTHATGGFRRTLPVTGPVDLQVHTGSGDIVARTGPPGTVSVVARVHASGSIFSSAEDRVRAVEQRPPIVQRGGAIAIERPDVENVAIDYELVVPADTRLRAETGSGDVHVRGVRRGVDADTGSGDIELSDVGGGARADTGSGDVRGDRVAAPIDVDTGSGDVRLGLAGPGSVRANTGSGNVVIRGAIGALSIDTGSGDVFAEGHARSGWDVHTSSGDVRLHLGPQTSYDLDVDTGSGDIDVGRPVHTTVRGRVDSSSDHLRGRVGSGGPLIRVETGSGDVAID